MTCRRAAVFLLGAVCLLALPWTLHAQSAQAATATQDAAPISPAQRHAPQPPLAWSSLDPAQQRMLAPVQTQWDQLRPARQHQLAEHADKWATLPAKRQQQIRERLTRWAAMTPQQRRQLRENARAYDKLTPEQRIKVREAFKKFQSLSPAERKALRERWRKLPPAQRKQWAIEHTNRPVPVHAPAHGGH